MITVWLECEHSLLMSPKEVLVKLNGTNSTATCPRDNTVRHVISAGHQWVVDCQQCNYTRYEGLGAKLAATVKAAKHMTSRGHLVETYRTDLPSSLEQHRPEVGLFAQLNPTVLPDVPPF